MTWVIFAGQDRSGKSTVAEHYKSNGYEYVHMSAPDKKYSTPGYIGPSYLDEMMELLMKYDGIDTVWDRSWYGEKLWPEIYGREPQLSEEDFEVIYEYEYKNRTEKFLMYDPNTKAHWDRIQKDTGLKPTTKEQFMKAGRAHMKLIAQDNFIQKTIHDFPKVEKPINKEEKLEKLNDEYKESPEAVLIPATGQVKLEKANAINTVLKTSIIKKKGLVFDELEIDIRKYLDRKLSMLLGEPQEEFTTSEVQILKTFCKQMQTKLQS